MRRETGRLTKTRLVRFPPELDSFVEEMVQSGEFANYSEPFVTPYKNSSEKEQERRIKLELHPEFVASMASAARRLVLDFYFGTIVKLLL